jgi:hypothetical protein
MARPGPWRVAGIAFLIVKAVIVVMTISGFVRPHAGRESEALWLLGKIVPEFVCVCFLVEAVTGRTSRRLVVFWTMLTIAVPFYAFYFALKQNRF